MPRRKPGHFLFAFLNSFFFWNTSTSVVRACLAARADWTLTAKYGTLALASPTTKGTEMAAKIKITKCCDGTGWTGTPRVICVEHYEPVDPIVFGR